MRNLGFWRRVPRFPFARCLAVAVVVLAFGCGTVSAQNTVTIDVFDFDFGNASTGAHIDPVITVGDTVRWVWVTGNHSTTSVVGQAETWNSGVQAPNFTFNHTFTQVGTFHYFCIPHGIDNGDGTAGGQMHGIVTVQPVPEPAMALLCTGLAASFVFGVRNRRRLAAVGGAPPLSPAPQDNCATGSQS